MLSNEAEIFRLVAGPITQSKARVSIVVIPETIIMDKVAY